MEQHKNRSIYIWKQVACTCKCYHQTCRRQANYTSFESWFHWLCGMKSAYGTGTTWTTDTNSNNLQSIPQFAVNDVEGSEQQWQSDTLICATSHQTAVYILHTDADRSCDLNPMNFIWATIKAIFEHCIIYILVCAATVTALLSPRSPSSCSRRFNQFIALLCILGLNPFFF